MLGQDDEMPVDMHMGDVREVTPPSRCLSPQRWPFVLLPPLDQKLFLPLDPRTTSLSQGSLSWIRIGQLG